MKGRFGTPLWVIPVLAMVMAIGAFAVMAGINQLSAHPAEASIQEAGQGLTSNIDSKKLSVPFTDGSLSMNAVVPNTGVTVNNPLTPGAAATFTFKFTPDSNIVTADELKLTWPKEFLVPATIDRNQVTIASTVNSGGTGSCAGISTDTVSPTTVSVEFVGADRIPEVTVTVPDMNGGDTCPGNQGLGANGEVTLIFRQTSGVQNAQEAADDYQVDLDTPAGSASFDVNVPWRVELSSPDGGRGSTLTLVGQGFKDGTTVTFWRDANADRQRTVDEAGPTGLCQGVSGSDFVATCTFTVQNPPFKPGFFDSTLTDASCNVNGVGAATGPVGCNYINAIDGRQNTVDLSLFPSPQARLDLQVYELRGSVTAQPKTGKPGDTLTIQLRDFPAGALTTFNVGGVNVSPFPPNNSTPDSTGSANFPVKIPNGVAQGVQAIQVANAASGTRRTNITVGGATLTLSQDEIIPNQDLTISGSGFTQSTSQVCIERGGITLADIPLHIKDTSDCTLHSGTPGIKLSSGGTFTVTVVVEQEDNSGNLSIPIALATPGTQELKIVDSTGAQGSATITIPERTLEVTPASARPRDIVTIIGKGFIADNPDGLSSSVNVTYDCGGGNSRSLSATPDVSGDFRDTLRIPSGCAIPSTNTITADILASNSTVDTETVTHEIPQAFVSVDPVRGASGTSVTVSGEGFRTFTAVDDIKFGSLSALGNRSVNTDGSGDFSISDLIVPGLDPGIHAVRVDVGTSTDPNRVTATTSFEVLAPGFEGAQTSDAQEVFGGISSLERAWLFDNTNKEWQFFDTRSDFTDINSLLEVPSGAPVWLKVTEDTEVELNGQSFNLTCVNPGTPEEDCWNLIVFP